MSSSKNSSTAVLMYHHVGIVPASPLEARYAVTEKAFEAQLKWLTKSEFEVLPLEAVPVAQGRRHLRVLLSFDDGFATDYEFAMPLLRRFNFKAVFFVSPALVGTPGYLNWDQIREMAAAGMHIGTHGYDHLLFEGISEQELRDQLGRSKKELSDQLDLPVMATSLPGGMGGSLAASCARSLGYRYIFGSRPTLSKPAHWANGVIPRLPVRSHHGIADVRNLLVRPLYRARLVTRYRLLRTLRSVVSRRHLDKLSNLVSRAVPDNHGESDGAD